MSFVLSVHCLDYNVSSSTDFEHSLHGKSGSDVEWSSKMNLVWCIHALSLQVLGSINIDDCPFLVDSVGLLGDSACLAFSVLRSFDLEDSFIFDVHQVVLIVLELLEPSSVSGPDLHVACSTGLLNIE